MSRIIDTRSFDPWEICDTYRTSWKYSAITKSRNGEYCWGIVGNAGESRGITGNVGESWGIVRNTRGIAGNHGECRGISGNCGEYAKNGGE